MGYSLWGHKELDTTERLTLTEESGFSREAEPRGRIARQEETHVIREADEGQDLQIASQRPRRANGVVLCRV